MESFDNLINGNHPVLVDFFATWCEPCKMLASILTDVKSSIGNRVTILKVDVDKNQQLMANPKFQVRGVPTLMLFQNGKVLWKQSGVVTKQEILKNIMNAIE